MAVTRSDLTTYLGGTLGELIAAVGMAATDTAGALKEPIDAALRLLGVDRADRATAEVDDDDGDAYEALATVTTLERLEQAAAALFDVSVRGDSFRLSQLFAALEKIRARLASARANPILAPYLGGGWSSGSLSFGWVEPEDEDAA
jgi:hypothetical protein